MCRERINTTGEMWRTIIADKLGHPYYSSLIGRACRVSKICESMRKGEKWKRNTMYARLHKGETTIYLKLKVRNHKYKETRPTYNKYTWWEIDELRESTPEEIKEAKQIEVAEAI